MTRMEGSPISAAGCQASRSGSMVRSMRPGEGQSQTSCSCTGHGSDGGQDPRSERRIAGAARLGDQTTAR